MADEARGFWKTVGEINQNLADRVKDFLAPERSEVELNAKKRAAEIAAMQKAEDAAKSYQPASDDQWAVVDKATARFKS